MNNSSALDAFSDVYSIFFQPYIDGLDHLVAGLSLKTTQVAKEVFTTIEFPFAKRLTHVTTGALLLIPIINLIVTVALLILRETNFYSHFDTINVNGDGNCLFLSTILGIKQYFPENSPFKNITATELRYQVSTKMLELYNSDVGFQISLDGMVDGYNEPTNKKIELLKEYKRDQQKELRTILSKEIAINKTLKPITAMISAEEPQNPITANISIEAPQDPQNPGVLPRIKLNLNIQAPNADVSPEANAVNEDDLLVPSWFGKVSPYEKAKAQELKEELKTLNEEKEEIVESFEAIDSKIDELDSGLYKNAIEYIEKSRKDQNIWGDDPHIRALHELLNFYPISVYREDFGTEPRQAFNMMNSIAPPIRLLYVGNCHYKFITRIYE